MARKASSSRDQAIPPRRRTRPVHVGEACAKSNVLEQWIVTPFGNVPAERKIRRGGCSKAPAGQASSSGRPLSISMIERQVKGTSAIRKHYLKTMLLHLPGGRGVGAVYSGCTAAHNEDPHSTKAKRIRLLNGPFVPAH